MPGNRAATAKVGAVSRPLRPAAAIGRTACLARPGDRAYVAAFSRRSSAVSPGVITKIRLPELERETRRISEDELARELGGPKAREHNSLGQRPRSVRVYLPEG